MTEINRQIFSPREGSVLDLESLQTLSSLPTDVHRAWLAARWPGATGLILEGLDLEGEPAPVGTPGTVRPDPLAGAAIVRPGRALVSGRDGGLYTVTLDAPLHVPWPDASGPRVRGTLVLYATHSPEAGPGGVTVARERLTVKLGFVKPDLASQPHVLPVARAVGNGQDWTTDLARIFQPEHAAIRQLLKRLERLEQTIWNAEPEGAVWDRQVLGRSWVRYQTVAAAAIQAAILELSVHGLTTMERARLLATLRRQLERSVERAATELLQVVAPSEASGPYRIVTGVGTGDDR